MEDNPETNRALKAGVDLISGECIAVRMRMLNRVVTSIFDDADRPLGLTIGQLNVLVAVERLKWPTQKEVGETLHMEKSTLSRNIERMKENGWLDSVQENGNRALQVTDRGRKLILYSLPLWERAQRQTRELLGTEWEPGLRNAAHTLWPSLKGT